jgi:CubicO group peptidase (beta-lactamase class C family)
MGNCIPAGEAPSNSGEKECMDDFDFGGNVPPLDNHVMFNSPTVTYTTYHPGGHVDGTTAKGWEPVKEAFEGNFAKGLEKNAQLVIRVDGKVVVDLWGTGPSGEKASNLGKPYNGDTMQNIFSSGKNIETVVMALLVERGLVDYDEKVATYWPEYARGGKGGITIAARRCCLHQILEQPAPHRCR